MHTYDHSMVCATNGRNGDAVVQEGPKGDGKQARMKGGSYMKTYMMKYIT